MRYSIFNQVGEGVEGETFETSAQAQAFQDATDWVAEYGPVHVGVICETHDEHEAGNCRYCADKAAADVAVCACGSYDEGECETCNRVGELLTPFLLLADDGTAHGTFETLEEARGAAAFDRLRNIGWEVWQSGRVVASSGEVQ
jgi:hypothetical protein